MPVVDKTYILVHNKRHLSGVVAFSPRFSFQPGDVKQAQLCDVFVDKLDVEETQLWGNEISTSKR